MFDNEMPKTGVHYGHLCGLNPHWFAEGFVGVRQTIVKLPALRAMTKKLHFDLTGIIDQSAD